MRIGPVYPGRAQKLTGDGVTWLVRSHEWPPGDVVPEARGHERPSPNLTVVARRPAARAARAGWCVRVVCGARPARLGPVGPARPSHLRVTLQARCAGVSGPAAG